MYHAGVTMESMFNNRPSMHVRMELTAFPSQGIYPVTNDANKCSTSYSVQSSDTWGLCLSHEGFLFPVEAAVGFPCMSSAVQ